MSQNVSSLVAMFMGIATRFPRNIHRYESRDVIKEGGAPIYAAFVVLEGMVCATHRGTKSMLEPGCAFNLSWLVGEDAQADEETQFMAVSKATVLSIAQGECQDSRVVMALLRASVRQTRLLNDQLERLQGQRLREMADFNAFFGQQADAEAAFARYRSRVWQVVCKVATVFPLDQRENFKAYFRDALGLGKVTESEINSAIDSIGGEDAAPPSSERGGRTLIGPSPANVPVLRPKSPAPLPPASVGRINTPVTAPVVKGKTLRFDGPPPKPPQK